MRILLLTLILCCAGGVHAQTKDEESLKQANKNLLAAYQVQKFDEALKFAQTTLKLSLKLYGDDNDNTATAYANLGAIYREKRNFSESAENLKKAMAIYQKKADKRGKQLAAIYQSLAQTYSADNKKKLAEEYYLKAIELTDKSFGADSKELLSPTLLTANFYAISKNVDKANELYLKSYKVAVKHFGKEAKQITEIDDAKSCIFASLEIEESKASATIFQEERREIVEPSEDDGSLKVGLVSGGIVSGKAIKLTTPKYPAEAKKQRLSGRIPIRVLIDENGDVTEAKSICGDSLLSQTSIEAAKTSKFTPTLLGGTPVKVSGTIIYNFTAR